MEGQIHEGGPQGDETLKMPDLGPYGEKKNKTACAHMMISFPLEDV